MPLVQKPFGDVITFTRASSATMFDSSGTLVYAPMNLLLWSEDFSQAAWTRQASVSVSTDTTVAPDGTTTADTITGNSGFGVFQQLAVTAGQRVTQSVYLKAGTATAVMFRDDTGAGRHIVVNPTTGVITSTSGTLIDSGSVSMGNGWYRLYFSYTADSTIVRGIVRPDSAGAGQTFILWGAQTNFYPMQGGVTADLSTYYPTTSAAYQGPRLDYDPATLLPRGFLVEEQRTNLLTYSEQFDNASGWTSARASVSANATTAPTGTSVADKIVEDTTASNTHLTFSADVSVSTATVYTYSVYAKAAGRTWFNMQIATGAGAYGATVPFCFFNLSGAGSVGTSGSATGSITAVGNGWYRCVLVAIATTSASTTNMRIKLASADGTDSYTGDGSSGIFVFGAQLEAGAFPTSYIPTTTTALTRSADVAAVNTLSPWFNATEGVLFVEASPQTSNVVTFNLVDLNNTTTSNRIALSKAATSGNASLFVNDAASPQCNISSATWTATGKLAGAYAANDFATSYNGATPVTDTSGTVPSVTRMQIGVRADGGNQLTGHIRRITYYPRRLSNAELQAITT